MAKADTGNQGKSVWPLVVAVAGFFVVMLDTTIVNVALPTIGKSLEASVQGLQWVVNANTLTWNTFPVPELDEKTRKRIIKAGQKVLAARALHPERSLAEHYNPLAMTPELVKAHDALDREVDKAMGAARKLTSERQRQELLFANYAKLTNN